MNGPAVSIGNRMLTRREWNFGVIRAALASALKDLPDTLDRRRLLARLAHDVDDYLILTRITRPKYVEREIKREEEQAEREAEAEDGTPIPDLDLSRRRRPKKN